MESLTTVCFFAFATSNEHHVTSGADREHQALDLLRGRWQEELLLNKIHSPNAKRRNPI